MPCANLRLYSVYGPLRGLVAPDPEPGARWALAGKYPPFVSPDISRDFVYVDDVAEAFVDTALKLEPAHYGDSFNIGSGKKTTIGEVAAVAAELFALDGRADVRRDGEPRLGRARLVRRPDEDRGRCWAGRRASTSAKGCDAPPTGTAALEDRDDYERASKQFGLDAKHSVSAIIACYKDGQAIPIMYERLKKTFDKLKIDYEIIFVNDNSPDDSEEVDRATSARATAA